MTTPNQVRAALAAGLGRRDPRPRPGMIIWCHACASIREEYGGIVWVRTAKGERGVTICPTCLPGGGQ